jgi:hypothetical protein
MTFRIPDWVGVLFLAPLCLARLVGTASMYRRTRSFLKDAITTVGVVTEVRTQTRALDDDDDGRRRTETYYTPVVRFYTADGKAVVFTSAVGTGTSYREGQQVPVVYAAARPEQAEIKSFLRLWFLPLVLLFAGVVQGIIALGLLAQWAKIKFDSQLITACVFTVIGLGLLTGAFYAYRHRAPPKDGSGSDNWLLVLVLGLMGLAFTGFGLAFLSKYIPV